MSKTHAKKCAYIQTPNIVDGNAIIRDCNCDGYHTFDELYEHRYLLFLHLINRNYGWKSMEHSDGTMFDGMFLASANMNDTTVDYHLPVKYWDLCNAEYIDKAPEWDGHTSDDVLERLLNNLE